VVPGEYVIGDGDIELLAGRLAGATEWVRQRAEAT
jgi:hypothetical protein